MFKLTLPKVFFTLVTIFSFFNVHAQDPIPDWVKDIGGTGESKLSGIAVDKNDNVYVAGNFQGTITIDHSGVSTPVSLSSNGNYDIFIAKYSPDGKLIWAKQIGGNGLDQLNNLAVDNSGSVILGASFNSSAIDCDPGPGVTSISSSGGDDALIVKLTSNGTFLWAQKIGSNGTERGHVVAADNLGNYIFVGSFSGTINLGAYTLTSKGSLDGFVAKYNNGGVLLWAYAIGAFGDDEIKSVKTNSANEIALMGYYGGTVDLNPKGPAYPVTGSSNTYFVAKYAMDGSLIWANKIDATNSQTPSSIAVGPTDDIFLTGVYIGSIIFNSPAQTVTLNSGTSRNLFITKYNNAGSTIWARNITSTASNPYSYYITADVDNNAYIGGFFDRTLTFTDGSVSKTLTYSGSGRNTFFAKYNGNGNYVWAFNFGSACDGNFGHKIAVDSKKNVLLGGAFCSTVDFNPATCVLNLTSKHGTSDAYISKYNQIKFSGDALITSFETPEQIRVATIDNVAKKVIITVKRGTDVTRLTPVIKTDIGVLSPLSGVSRDFTTPKNYTITSNCIDYVWSVEVLFGDIDQIKLCSEEPTLISGYANPPENAVFLWQTKDAIGNWVMAPNPGATFNNYNFKGILNNGNTDIILSFRRMISTSTTTSYDSEIELVIHPGTYNNIISSPQSSYCNGQTPSITGSIPDGGVTNSTFIYKWQQSNNGIDFTDIGNATSQNYSPTSLSGTIYFRRVIEADNCKSYSNVLKLEIYEPIATAEAGGNIELCDTKTVQLSANMPKTDETGTWSVVSPAGYNPFTPQNLHQPNAVVNDIPEDLEFIFKWTIKHNICSSEASDEVKIINHSAPNLSLPIFMTVNEGQSLPIPAVLTPKTGVTYSFKWTPADNLDNPTLLSPIVTPTKTDIYKLQISYGNCVLEREIKVIFNKAIRLDYCPSMVVTLQGAVDHDPLSVYQWQELVGADWVDIVNANQFDLITTTPDNFTNTAIQKEYRRKVTNSPYYDSRYILNISPRTTNNTIQTSQSVFCTNAVNNLLIEGSTPIGASSVAITYRWQQSENGSDWTDITSGNSKNITISTILNSTFFRRITFAGDCGSISNTLQVIVNLPATIASAGDDVSNCNTNISMLNANPVASNEVGTWSVISPAGYNPFTAQNVNDPKAMITNIPENANIVVRWTIKNNNCGTETFDELKIFNYGIPNLAMPVFMTVNEGQSLPIPATLVSVPGIAYNFQWNPTAQLNNPNQLTPTVTPTETGIYQLRINYGTCVMEREIKVIFNKAIRLDFCPTTAVTLQGAVDNDPLSVYQWQELSGTDWLDLPNATQFNLELTTPENVTSNIKQVEYRRKVLNSPYYDSRYILNITPTTTNNVIQTVQSIFCSGKAENLLLTGTVPSGAESITIRYKWQQSDDGNNWKDLTSTSKDLSLQELLKSSYFKRITFAGNCERSSNILEIKIYPSATIAYAGSNREFCSTTTVTLNSNAAGQDETGAWSVKSPIGYNPFTSANINNPNATITNLPLNKDVVLTWSIHNNNCNTTTTSDVTMISYQNLVVQGPPKITMDLGKKINLGVIASSTVSLDYTYQWTPSLGLDRDDVLNPVASPTDNTTYRLKVSYGANCFSYFSVDIIVLKAVEIPNSFSPNGDGINDNWEVKNLANYPGSRISIYNRYGALLFQSGPIGSWDGRHKGNVLPIGTYYYVVEVKNKTTQILTGSITILN